MLYSEKWKTFHVVFLCVFILTDIIFLAVLIFVRNSFVSTGSGSDNLGPYLAGLLASVSWLVALILELVGFFCGRYLLRDQKYAFDLE